MNSMDNLKNLFLLDPNIIYLNHGSFGACPKPIFEIYQNWQRQLEREPVEFLGRRSTQLLADSRQRLAQYLRVNSDDVVYFTNPTTAINMVAHNLFKFNNPLIGPGDEILTTNHEYGAMDRTWRYLCKQSGARYVQKAIPLPLEDEEGFIKTFWSGVNQRTRVIFMSHVTSPTALRFPVAEICRRARRAGILTIIDGAHAPGQIPLDLSTIDADFYSGACHKWLCAPKGAAFLYAHKDVQSWLDPLVVSWGYESEKPSASQYIDYHEWQGTRDLAAFLSVPSAIDFIEQYDWESIRFRSHQLAIETRNRINQVTGLTPISSDDWFNQMVSIRLPDQLDLELFKENLFRLFHIEVPTILWNRECLLRVSFQAYNTQEDADALVEAIRFLLL